MRIRAIIAAVFLLAPAAVLAAPPEATIEQRLQLVEDELAIKRVVLDYAVRLDARDFDGYVALFAKDGTWQNGNVVKHGREEIRAMLVGIYGDPPAGYVNNDSYRIVSNVQVDISGDHAIVHSRQLTIMRGENGSPTPRLSGIYDDDFVREDGEWKILHRIDRTIMPSREEWAQYMAQRKAEQERQAN